MNPDVISGMTAAVIFALAVWAIGRFRDNIGISKTNVGSNVLLGLIVVAVIVVVGSILWRIQGMDGLFYFALMTLGSICKWAWDAITDADGGTVELKPQTLALPVLVSMLTYSVFLSGLEALKPGSTPSLSEQFAPYLLCFQNGFFWKTVFDKAFPTTPNIARTS